VQPDGDEGDVVVGIVGEHAGQQLVAELVEVAAGEVGQGGLQLVQAVVEVGVPALRERLADVDCPLTAMLRRSAQALFTQISRNAAYDRVHTVRRRAARWLLTTADRMDSPSFELTQHFLAQLLAVRRASVSEVAQSLAEDGCITYTRGLVTITDRPRLQSHACTCYEAIGRATDAALAAR
jgi:hypothetical protein